MLNHDTICAVSTAVGEGGIGIVRMSGPEAVSIASRLFHGRAKQPLADVPSHSLHYGCIIDPQNGEIIDEVLLSVMRGPSTYTREDVVEINCHGGMMPLSRTLALVIRSGARQAEPGEFTRRAFLNGRIDLAQAEAVMDAISAKTDVAHRAANEQLSGGLSREIENLRGRMVALLASIEAGIDFPDEDIQTIDGRPLLREISALQEEIARLIEGYRYGRILRTGFSVAIVGRPNVGKSSLLNALLRQDRAIVTEIPGTTRDVLEEYLNIQGVPFRILDTAGIRHAHDVVEQEGIRRSIAAIEAADIVLVVLDSSRELHDEDRRVLNSVRQKNVLAVLNKSDLVRVMERLPWPDVQISLSCTTGSGIEALKTALSNQVITGVAGSREQPWVINQRHKTALEQAGESFQKARDAAASGLSPEFIALDVRAGLDSLGLIVGATYTDDILDRIFNDFCIGK